MSAYGQTCRLIADGTAVPKSNDPFALLTGVDRKNKRKAMRNIFPTDADRTKMPGSRLMEYLSNKSLGTQNKMSVDTGEQRERVIGGRRQLRSNVLRWRGAFPDGRQFFNSADPVFAANLRLDRSFRRAQK
ncbi:MAG: hypothetical protein LBQ54_08035 [Planctomycetaceae bacterium]|jgi:hypothetical protein|nr:hypothetical protein [Planctomycetaceae bacterium]